MRARERRRVKVAMGAFGTSEALWLRTIISSNALRRQSTSWAPDNCKVFGNKLTLPEIQVDVINPTRRSGLGEAESRGESHPSLRWHRQRGSSPVLAHTRSITGLCHRPLPGQRHVAHGWVGSVGMLACTVERWVGSKPRRQSGFHCPGCGRAALHSCGKRNAESPLR